MVTPMVLLVYFESEKYGTSEQLNGEVTKGPVRLPRV